MSWTGLAAGIESGLRSYERVKRIQADDARYKAEADRLDREKRDRDVLDDINKTMTGAMGGDMDPAPTAEQPSAAAQQGTLRSMIGVQPEPQQSSAPQGGALRARFGGEQPAAPQGQGMSTPPAQRGPASLKDAGAPREVPRERRMVDAYRKGWARAFELGRPDLGMQYFQKETELRELLTRQALDKADRQFAVTQDPRVYIAPYNDLAPDGVRIEGMTPVLTADGSQAWKVVSRMPDMAEPVEQVIPGDQLGMMVQQLHDPSTVRRSMLEVAQKQRESLIKRQEKEYESELRLKTEGQLIDRRTAGNLRVVGAQGAQSRETAKFKDGLPNAAGAAKATGPLSTIGKEAADMVRMGIAQSEADAARMLRTDKSLSQAVQIVMSNPIAFSKTAPQLAEMVRETAAMLRTQQGGAQGADDAGDEEDFSGLWQ